MASIAFRAVCGVTGAQIRANKRKTRRTNPPKISQASSRDVPGGRETKSGGQQNRLTSVHQMRQGILFAKKLNTLRRGMVRATRAGRARKAFLRRDEKRHN